MIIDVGGVPLAIGSLLGCHWSPSCGIFDVTLGSTNEVPNNWFRNHSNPCGDRERTFVDRTMAVVGVTALGWDSVSDVGVVVTIGSA